MSRQMDMVQRIHRKMKEQSVASSPQQILVYERGAKWSFATTLPSNMEFNIPSRAVKRKLIANMDFI